MIEGEVQELEKERNELRILKRSRANGLAASGV